MWGSVYILHYSQHRTPAFSEFCKIPRTFCIADEILAPTTHPTKSPQLKCPGYAGFRKTTVMHFSRSWNTGLQQQFNVKKIQQSSISAPESRKLHQHMSLSKLVTKSEIFKNASIGLYREIDIHTRQSRKEKKKLNLNLNLNTGTLI